MKFKYNINHKISLQPRELTVGEIQSIAETHGISPATFNRDRAIPIGSNQSMPTDRLDAYAFIFGCPADDLKNYTVTGMSIKDLLLEKELEDKVKSKSGLQ